jgi:hypothetical protein
MQNSKAGTLLESTHWDGARRLWLVLIKRKKLDFYAQTSKQGGDPTVPELLQNLLPIATPKSSRSDANPKQLNIPYRLLLQRPGI